jgi:2,4-didehydro-3-deoxy-L-rhamnonate hydrolase
MKLARFGNRSEERPALVDAHGRLRDLSSHLKDIGPATLNEAELARLAAIDIESLPFVLDQNARLGPPVGGIGKIICIGLNYTDHAAEVGLPPPLEPTIFIKACHATGPNDSIRLPRGSEKGDWEVELGIIVGRGGLYIEEANALDNVAGFCLVNDVSERSYQMERGGQWTKGKSFPGFAPIGPWMVTKDELPNFGALRLWLEVNGQRFQDGTTSNLIFGVERIVSYVSQFYALEPGDLIATGTPAGVGLGHKPPVFLKDGDIVTLGAEGLGTQRQTIHAWTE